jgi:hypothetical protein
MDLMRIKLNILTSTPRTGTHPLGAQGRAPSTSLVTGGGCLTHALDLICHGASQPATRPDLHCSLELISLTYQSWYGVFSLTINQRTVFFSLAFQPSERDSVRHVWIRTNNSLTRP